MPSGQSSREISSRVRRVAGPLEEQAEDLEGLGVELDADALVAELSGGGVGFEDSEAIALRWGVGRHVLGQCTR